MVIARPMIVTRSPFSSTPTNPDRGDTWRPTSDARPSRSTQYGASTVCAAGNRILRNTGLWGKNARDEVILVSWFGHRSLDQADGGIEHFHCSKVGTQVADRTLVGDERQQERPSKKAPEYLTQL